MAAATAVIYQKFGAPTGDYQVTDEKTAAMYALATSGGRVKGFWSIRCTMDPASLNDGVGETDTIAVPGVALGDVVAWMSASVDLAGVTATAYVSAAAVVSIRYQNESAGTVNLASHTILMHVLDLT